MDKSFYIENRADLYSRVGNDAIIVMLAGHAPRRSADAYYGFYCNRNFAYITGASDASTQGFVFMAEKHGGNVRETLFILPPDAHAERWNGRRMKPDEARALTGIEEIAMLSEFEGRFHRAAMAAESIDLWTDIDRLSMDEPESETIAFTNRAIQTYPSLRSHNLLPLLRDMRTIKKPCEIEAMRKAMTVTREGILAMMRGSRPGMYEYEYKALYDAALTRNGVLEPGFPSIISAGDNNFCIHYYAYTGRAKDGDMILNDVGACWDNLGNDVSRGFPCNGKFSERQRLLYTCAYNTSNYMFSIIKPGMPMASVDQTARRYCYEQLKAIGLCESYDDIGKYMWHGGAHHVGFDTHDVVDMTRPIAPGMVFCVDIGIYCQEWGIGFRLEDNCLVTEDGCENLSRDIPRSIEEIEAVMAK
ncbi:MAG: aminopeptidase P N-terminal domain-containing protein [Candidatus Fimadaptatus sp.]|jgi:Xaa-Pro aminopeptidase